MNPLCRLIRLLEETIVNNKRTMYGPPDMLGSLYIISRNPGIGRINLARRLGLGEQIVRRMLKQLVETGLLYLGDKGKSVSDKIIHLLRRFTVEDVVGEKPVEEWDRNIVFLLCNGKQLVDLEKNLVKLRDSIVRWGGEGAVIFEYRKGRVYMPGEPVREIEKKMNSVIVKMGLEKCDGVFVLIGMKNEGIEWYPVYGFLEKLCRLQDTA